MRLQSPFSDSTLKLLPSYLSSLFQPISFLLIRIISQTRVFHAPTFVAAVLVYFVPTSEEENEEQGKEEAFSPCGPFIPLQFCCFAYFKI